MPKLTTECPGCGQQLTVSRLSCSDCEMQLEGQFELPELLRLNRDDLEFVLQFVRCAGSVKDLCTIRGQSYPTVRNRLTEIIERLAAQQQQLESKRKKILDAVAKGTLSVKNATQKLKELNA